MPYRQTARTKQRRTARRNQILAAAKQLFASQGYEATTIQQVVQAAGTSIGNCYFYFRNKEELLLAVVDQFNSEIGQAIDQAVAATPAGPGQLAVAVYTGMVTVLRQADLARQVLVGTANPTLRLKIIAYFTERVRRFFAAYPELLGQADPELVAHAWTGSLFNVLEKALTGDVARDPATLGHFLARWNLQALGQAGPQVEQSLAILESAQAYTNDTGD